VLSLLRLAAAGTAGCGLVLHVLNLAFLAWAGTAGTAGELGLDGGGLLPQALTVLPWGVGFSALALAMVVRIGDRHEVLIAALFLGVYSLWGGVLFPLPLRGEAWLPAAAMIFDGFTHAIGIRFTQVFPRPLAEDDLRDLGPRPLRPVVAPVLTTLLKPRVYWPAALAFEASVHLLPVDLVPGVGHLVVWLALGTTYMYASYRGGSAEDQRRIFWILEGVLVFLVAEVLLVGLRIVSSAGLVELDLRAWYAWIRAGSAWGTVASVIWWCGSPWAPRTCTPATGAEARSSSSSSPWRPPWRSSWPASWAWSPGRER